MKRRRKQGPRLDKLDLRLANLMSRDPVAGKPVLEFRLRAIRLERKVK